MRDRLIVPIVEGHGEVASIRILLHRIWHEVLGSGLGLVVESPIRLQRGRVTDAAELGRWLDYAAVRLRGSQAAGTVLLLFDADHDPACELAPRLLALARRCRADLDVACVLPTPEYETWFVAAAESLGSFLSLRASEPHLEAPELGRVGKQWVRERHPSRYSETLDQPSMTAAMDLALCRSRSPSFDKLCRELAARAAIAPLGVGA